MEIVLSLLRTLVFVVATVAATVYVGRRIGRGRPLLWTGTTLLALHWLVLFGYTSYLAGSAAPNPDLGVWVGWIGHLLPFAAALAYVWGIGQAAGFPSRTPEGGPGTGKTPTSEPAPAEPSRPQPSVPPAAAGGPAATAGASGTTQGASRTPVPPTPTPAAAAEPAAPAPKTQRSPQPFPVPHAVPVVITPSATTNLSPEDPPARKRGIDPGADGRSSGG